MSGHSYDKGRLNLPFVGISTFGKRPYVADWSAIDAEVAVLGAPFDFGTQFRAGARFGPRAVREASTLFSFGHAGAYEAMRERIPDAELVYYDTAGHNICDGYADRCVDDLLAFLERRGYVGAARAAA